MFIAPGSVVGFFPAYHHFAIPWHDHDFYELGIVESGSGRHVTPSGGAPVRGGAPGPSPTPGHDHDFYGLGIVESGWGLHVSPSGSEPFRRGTVVLVPPGAGHEYR